ncbi:unnamed protein product [Rotaria magnacalcarata]|uniref:Uncharacterized protein n=1 Tax=Rotaria magnacalcarata TaxID=392030 RepID=A0A815BND4_9BILA|nr:unnamed protein product [Rotaria magnacalcarata]CAF1658777.1 unnamed protein product [Rotaria magnacalcarata]CAF4130591.1 unnamed protein product [Rotaria magnacalcarata]CAF5200814.1 unnamed protein product [Rotaria magnacalcarata]
MIDKSSKKSLDYDILSHTKRLIDINDSTNKLLNNHDCKDMHNDNGLILHNNNGNLNLNISNRHNNELNKQAINNFSNTNLLKTCSNDINPDTHSNDIVQQDS